MAPASTHPESPASSCICSDTIPHMVGDSTRPVSGLTNAHVRSKETFAKVPPVRPSCRDGSIPDVVLVVAACFAINSIYGGVFYVSGLYLHCFLETFGEGKVTTAWVISLQGSLTYFAGLVSGPLIVRFGPRKVAVAGALCSFIGFLLSAFAPNIVFLYITYGILSGIGFGMMMISNAVCVQQHSSRRRALAAGLALCGSGVGALVMPQVVKLSMSAYGWRGSVILLSGILLHCLPCCMLLRPPRIPTPVDTLLPDPEEDLVPEELLEDGVQAPQQKLLVPRSADDTGSLQGGTVGSKSSADSSRMMMRSNSHSALSTSSAQPRDQQLVAGSTMSVAMMFSSTISIPHHGSASLRGSSHSADASNNSISDQSNRTFFQVTKDMLSSLTSNNGYKLSPVVLLVITCWFFFFAGMPVTYVFCAVKAVSIGLGAPEGALLLSIGGLGEILGRVLGSGIGSCHEGLPLVIFVLNAILSGLSCALLGVCATYTHMLVAVLGFGVTMGMCSCMSSTVVRDLVGITQIPWVFGFAFAMGGVGNMFSIQILALIWEKTNAVKVLFITGGGFLVLTGLVMVAAHIAHLRVKPEVDGHFEEAK